MDIKQQIKQTSNYFDDCLLYYSQHIEKKQISRFWDKKANGKLSISQRNSKKKKKFLDKIEIYLLFVPIFLHKNEHRDLNI